MATTLDDLMLAAGVLNAPAFFKEIGLPNWPMPHQMETLKRYAKETRYADLSTPGVGKTYPCQAHALLMASLGNKVVVTMPPKLIRQFEQEFKDFFVGIENHLKIAHLDVGAVQKAKLRARWNREGWPDILLVSYNTFRDLSSPSNMTKVPKTQWKLPDGSSYFKDKEPVNPKATPVNKYGDTITPKGFATNKEKMLLYREGYSVYFFDEAHALCNPSSKAWKAANALEGKNDDVAMYLMTGTPIPTHLHNVYGIISLINRSAYMNKSQFKRKHVILNPNSQYEHILGYKNEPEVYRHLYKNAVRVQKRDVLDMEDPIISTIPLKLTGKHKKLYDQIIRDRFAILGDKVLTPDNDSALRMLALQLISSPDQFDSSGEIGKENELAKHMDELMDSINPANNKVIVVAHFRSTVKSLAERYAQWSPAVVNGSSTESQEEIRRFKEDDNCRVLVINWQSGGAGLNLQVSSHTIFYECPTSPKDAKQVIARTDRMGQKSLVNIYIFRVLGTLYDRNFKNLLKNEEQNNEVVKDKHDLLHTQLGVKAA